MCCLFFCRMMKNKLTTFVLPLKYVAMTAPVLTIATMLMKMILEMTCKTLPRNPELPLQLKVDPSGLINCFCFYLCLFSVFLHVNGGVSQAVAVKVLLFLVQILLTIHNITHIEVVKKMAAKIPRSWNSLLTFVGIKRSAFRVWVVCPKCPTVYEYEHAMHKTHRGVKSAECQHIRYPNQKQARLRAPCMRGNIAEKRVNPRQRGSSIQKSVRCPAAFTGLATLFYPKFFC